MKVLIAVPLLLLAVLGAGGMSSIEDDDFCGRFPRSFPEGSGSSTQIRLSPPGWRCVYEAPDGRRATTGTGSWTWFLVALAGELGVAAWYLRRRSTPARMAVASTVALATAGAFSLLGGLDFAFFWALTFGIPLAWLLCGQDLAAALAAGAGVFVAAVFTLFFGVELAVIGCFVAVALVAAVAALPGALRTGQRAGA
jgi:hypothetical protein